MKALLLVTFLFAFILPVKATEEQNVLRVDDVRLTHPFKAGLLKGATLGAYQFTRTEMVLKQPYDAQLPIGFEKYVIRHGQFAYVLGISMGAAWSICVLGFIFIGAVTRLSALSPRRTQGQCPP